MKLFTIRKDGGPDSNVTGYWLFEIKSLFSIALLRFDKGSREAYHSHAFNCVSWVLKGELLETMHSGETNTYKPSLRPVVTTRDCMHRVFGIAEKTWVLTFRGPWTDRWHEVLPGNKKVTLAHGRQVVETEWSAE